MGLSSRRHPALFLAALLFALPAVAGTTADLKGKVTDGAGRPLPGASLVLRNDFLAVGEQGTLSASDGSFRFLRLPPGRGYRLRASLPAFATLEFTDVELAADQTYNLDIVLRPASELQETVRIAGHGDLVSTEHVATSTTFSSEFIAGLPILGRDYQDVLTLAPGVTDVNGTGNPNIHGARDTDVGTLVDGVSTTDPLTGYFGQQLNIESIQEIEVITSGATADFGRAQGGFANIVTKSGGNEFRGTFKLFVRTHRLDGDGAGVDPPEVRGGIGENKDFRDLRFTDLKPFLSLSGAIVRNRLWYYLANEYLQEEVPVDAVTQVFIARQTGYREFAKLTWQIAPSHKLAFSANLDSTRNENEGIDSLTALESGYTFKRGGPTLTLRETAVFGPSLLLESHASWFDNSFSQTPTLDPDTNHNGILFVDGRPDLGGNGDGILQPRERDSGEDYDRDRAYGLFEDFNGDGVLGSSEDLDRDGRLTPLGGCEGADREDLNCNGRVDREIDLNLNGVADPDEDTGIPCGIPGQCPGGTVPGTAHNGRLDTEDRNGNGALDTLGDSGYTSFPFWMDGNGDGVPEPGEYRAPLAPDEDSSIDAYGRTSGPYPLSSQDHRKRFSLREEMSAYVEGPGGSHDLKVGAVYENEKYDRDLTRRPLLDLPSARVSIGAGGTPIAGARRVFAYLGYPVEAASSARGHNLAFYLQDTYRPLPNLVLGLGFRLDLEQVESSGYTSFDPAGERRDFDGLMAIAGFDTEPYDTQTPLGLCGDPLFVCSGGGINDLGAAQILNSLKSLAPRRLTRHNAAVDFLSPTLAAVLGKNPTLDDLIAAGINPRRPEPIRIRNLNAAPRLSVSWDPFADGKTKAFASWGRYYDKLFLASVTGEEGPDTLSRTYFFDEDGVDGSGLPDHQIGRPLSQSPLSAYQVDRNLSTPYADELTLGFQREIAPELALRLTYIRRDYRRQLQDLDLNHTTRVDPRTGHFTDILGDLEEPLGPRDQGQQFPDGLPDLFNRNLFFNRVLRLGNFNEQEYRGWEVELVRRLSRKWQMESSYTHSTSFGDAESFQSLIGDDPALAEFERGYLDYDQRHVVKLNAIAWLPRDWQIGGTAQWASGLPYSIIASKSATDDQGFAQSRILYGYHDSLTGYFIPEARNSHRNHAVYTFNARTQKSFILGKASASLFLEVFNLLNSDDLRVFTLERPLYNSDSLVTRIGVNGERRFGRRFQIGFQVDF